MQLCFVSNYINHHQIPFCDAMYEFLQGEFCFLQMEEMAEERIRMGWQSTHDLPYVKKYYEGSDACQNLIDNSAVVIYGGVEDERYLVKRLQDGKPVIRYSERLYKTGQWKAVSPRGLIKKYTDHTKYCKKDVYLLCAGAYVASDFHIVRAYPNKMLSWGYFPETKNYDVDKLLAEKGFKLECATDGDTRIEVIPRILWAARFLDWKHPELPLETAKWLKDKGYRFHMDIIGGGEEEATVKRLYEEYALSDVVTLQGYKTPEEVRAFMEKADIYLMTSDRMEGWGAVVNEAMNSGCAVIGNHMVGAVPYLIRHGENGFLYRDGCKEQLFELAAKLLESEELRKTMGRRAYRTITEEWNAREAAKRLVAFCIKCGFLPQEAMSQKALSDIQGYLEQEELYFSTGPGSAASVISERSMFRRLTSGVDKKQ